MDSELVQFGAMMGMFLIGAVAWLFIIYLPGRSMEGGWQGDRTERRARKVVRESSRKDRETTTV